MGAILFVTAHAVIGHLVACKAVVVTSKVIGGAFAGVYAANAIEQ